MRNHRVPFYCDLLRWLKRLRFTLTYGSVQLDGLQSVMASKAQLHAFSQLLSRLLSSQLGASDCSIGPEALAELGGGGRVGGPAHGKSKRLQFTQICQFEPMRSGGHQSDIGNHAATISSAQKQDSLGRARRLWSGCLLRCHLRCHCLVEFLLHLIRHLQRLHHSNDRLE